MTKGHNYKLLVLDINAPWIRSLVSALPENVSVHGVRVFNVFSRDARSSIFNGILRQCSNNNSRWNESSVFVPGWHKFFRLSSFIVRMHVRRLRKLSGGYDALLLTLPWYAHSFSQNVATVSAYYAHDTFRFYGWDRKLVISLERELISKCDLGFGVADLVCSDLGEMSKTPVDVLPMATGFAFDDSVSDIEHQLPHELESIPYPRVGCIGQINSTYDWPMLRHAFDALKEVNFVFIGPISSSEKDREVVSCAFSRPNVHWLGSKPHHELRKYLNGFNALLCPLIVNDHSNRRFPLRLFDYMTTSTPIVCTSIDSARFFEPHLLTANTPEDLVNSIVTALKDPKVDIDSRRKFIEQNTWRVRAKYLSEMMFDFPKKL